MENKFQYIVEEYQYGTTRHNEAFVIKINEMGDAGYKLISSQLKPFKNDRTNCCEMICIFEKTEK